MGTWGVHGGNKPLKLSVQEYAQIIEALRGGSSPVSAAEQRQAARMTVHATLQVALLRNGECLQRQFTALTRDISLTGLGLFQSIATNRGDEFVIALPHRGRMPLFVVCRVMHFRPLAEGVYGVGAEYARLASEQVSTQLSNSMQNQTDRIRDCILQ